MSDCKTSRLPAILSLFIASLAWSQAGFADWRLDADNSDFYYVTSKAAAVSEVNTFGELSGTIDADGNANLIIRLASVDTAVDIRNERMREILFEVANYPLATINLKADGRRLSSLAKGESYRREYQATVDLHGQSQEVTADIVVTKTFDGGLQVNLAKPLLISAATFGLADKVDELQEIAKLPSINHTVVVDFSLQFDVTD